MVTVAVLMVLGRQATGRVSVSMGSTGTFYRGT